MDRISPMLALSFIFILVVSMVTVEGATAPCQEDAERVTKVHDCIDPLKTHMQNSPPNDINEFLCSPGNKPKVECLIKEIKECPGFLDLAFVMQFALGEFEAADLTKVSSADHFCECAPTLQCLDAMDLTMLIMKDPESAYPTMPNPVYMCKDESVTRVECVSKALPTCKVYLQSKRRHFTDEVAMAVNATEFLDTHCSLIESSVSAYLNDSECVRNRSRTLGFLRCNEGANIYVQMDDRECGLYRCVAMLMKTCPEGWMEYYIDAANLFLEEKIEVTKVCPVISSAASIVASLLFVMFGVLVSRG